MITSRDMEEEWKLAGALTVLPLTRDDLLWVRHMLNDGDFAWKASWITAELYALAS